VRIKVINITLSYKHTLRIEVAYTNYFINSLDIYINKTPVPSFSILFIYPFVNKKPYYSSGLSLNGSINPTSISL